jgi:hypothetical protein
MLRCWHLVWILVRTDHPYLGVRCHSWSPPRTQSTPVPLPVQTLPKATNNVRGKSHSQHRKMSSNATKGKKQVTQANPKLSTPMTQANPNFVLGKPMLTVDALKQSGKFCVELHNY